MFESAMEFFPARQPCSLSALPTLAAVRSAQGLPFAGVTLIDHPRAGCLTFCERLPASDAVNPAFNSTVLTTYDLVAQLSTLWPAARLLAVDDPRALFIDTLEHLQREDMLGLSSLLPAAPKVSPAARIGERAIIEAGSQVDEGASIGCGAVIRAGTWLRRGARVGENSIVGGTGVNAYLGKDGRRRGFPHLAGVIVGEGTSIGASCVIVRGILSSTRIEAGCIVGNLCNIGHGVEIDVNAWISVGTMIGGHTRVGARATIAMGCAIRDNVCIGTGANIGMGSVVTKHVRAGASVFGNPARPHTSIIAGPRR